MPEELLEDKHIPTIPQKCDGESVSETMGMGIGHISHHIISASLGFSPGLDRVLCILRATNQPDYSV